MNKRNKVLVAVAFAALSLISAQTNAWAQNAEGQAPAAPAALGSAGVDAPAAPSSAVPAPSPSVATTKVIYLRRDVPYADTKVIDAAILNECQLPQQSGDSLEKSFKKAGLSVVRDDAAFNNAKGRVLKIEITGAMSRGHAWGFGGHRKHVEMRGALSEDGKEVAFFVARRRSTGGAMGGSMSSCAVLVRCVDAIADDVARWLQNPVPGARLGDG